MPRSSSERAKALCCSSGQPLPRTCVRVPGTGKRPGCVHFVPDVWLDLQGRRRALHLGGRHRRGVLDVRKAFHHQQARLVGGKHGPEPHVERDGRGAQHPLVRAQAGRRAGRTSRPRSANARRQQPDAWGRTWRRQWETPTSLLRNTAVSTGFRAKGSSPPDVAGVLALAAIRPARTSSASRAGVAIVRVNVCPGGVG